MLAAGAGGAGVCFHILSCKDKRCLSCVRERAPLLPLLSSTTTGNLQHVPHNIPRVRARVRAPPWQYLLLPPSLEPLNSRVCSLNPTAATIVASMAAEELYSSSFSSRPLRALLDAASSVCIRQGIPCDTVAHAAC